MYAIRSYYDAHYTGLDFDAIRTRIQAELKQLHTDMSESHNFV